MPTVLFTETARQNIRDIARWIASENRKAARDWVAAIGQRCDLLARHPLLGRVRPDLSIDALVFPYRHYLIFYDRTDGGIIVLHVIDPRRDIPNMPL